MEIAFSQKPSPRHDIVIFPVFDEEKTKKRFSSNINRIIEIRKKNKEFKGKEGETTLIYPDKKDFPPKIILIGYGKVSKLTAANVRTNTAIAFKTAMKHKLKNLTFRLVNELEGNAQSIAEGATLVNYTYAKFKTGKNAIKAKENLFKKVTFVSNKIPASVRKNLERGFYIGESVNETRDLVNGPANIISPAALAEEAVAVARKNKYKVKVYTKDQLKKMKMGALLGVNQGSFHGPRLVVMEYTPKKVSKKDKPIVLVGKGIVFDSGGLNLKPTRHIETMQQDMAGAAAVIGAFSLLKKLQINKKVIGILPITENLVDAKAQRPSDIVVSHSGKTIEITNTDAEGRLILADGISYAQTKYNPEYIIDIATLTGACIVALGDRYSAVFGNNKDLIEKLVNAGIESDELLWELPIHTDYRKLMDGQFADVRNADNGTSFYAGASKAAAFIEKFIDKTKWAHLDIAGTAFVDNPKKYDIGKATGVGVRLFIKFLEDLK